MTSERIIVDIQNKRSKLPTLMNIASQKIWLRGERMNTRDFGLFRPFYDSKAKRVIIKAGRQIGKSTGLAIKQCIRGACTSHLHMLTVLPLSGQTQRFSRLYVDSVMYASPDLKKMISNKDTYSVGMKMLLNNTVMHYSYAGDNPDRIRGISVRDIYWDEIQDIHIDSIPIVEQCAKAYANSRFSYTGTPKTLDNTMEGMWLRSSQMEPVIKCSRCNHENFCILPDVLEMIQREGLSCQKCKKVLRPEDIFNAYYVAMVPSKFGKFDGYHIPQIFTPRNCLVPEQWDDILYTFDNESEAIFANECLGLSFDSGGRPVTRETLLQATSNRKLGKALPGEYSNVYMGVDWGYATSRSYTVISIVGVTPTGQTKLIHAKKYRYRNRLEQIKEIVQLYHGYGCTAIGCDHGVGLTDNLELRDALGEEAVYEFCYTNGRAICKYDKDRLMYIINRTKTLNILFTDLNKKRIEFCNEKEMEPFFDDIMSVYEEVRVTPGGEQKFYNRTHSQPDDFMHALNFCVMTARLLTTNSVLCSIDTYS